MPRPRASVRRTGEWGRARRIMTGLSFKLRRATERGMKEESEAAVRRMRNNIFAQNYDHAPLSDWQQEDKESEGKDGRTLIEDGTYVRSLQSFQLSAREWGIGFGAGDTRNSERGALLEFGGTNNLGRNVPARPHFRVELERIRNGRLPELRTAMRSVLSGSI